MKSNRLMGGAVGLMAMLLIVGMVTAIMGANSSIGPWPVQSAGIQGSGSFSVTGTAPFYLSSGTTTATSVPCNWVCISVSTSNAKLSTTTSGALSLAQGLAPLTLSCSNLNSLQVTGTNAVIGYLYGG